MISYLFKQLFNSFGVFFRTIRAFFTRQLNGLGSRMRRMTNFSRHATKVASESFQAAATAMKPPTKREDYIETKGLFVAKSFLLKLLIGLIILGCLIYFLIWPFLLSHFFTAHFWQGDDRVEDWTGKVIVYYDESKDIPMYAGKLEEGVLQGKGKEYDENGLLIYEGNFTDGQRTGKGQYFEEGVLVYEGYFSDGAYEGAGALYEDGVLIYEGEFSDSLYNGKGTEYSDSGKLYTGSFQEGVYSGEGTLYYPDGQRAYVGQFANGVKEGEGTLYREDGTLCYKGEFSENLFHGAGTYYLEDDRGYIQADFSDGVTDGEIKWYIDGKLWYAGGAVDLLPDGYGEVYLKNGDVVYAGEMDRGTIDGQWLLSLTAEEVRQAFAQASVAEKTSSGGGFYIMNRELGLVVRCSYQSGEEESKAFSAWISRQGSNLAWQGQPAFAVWSDTLKDETNMEELFPWGDPEQFHQWSLGTEGVDPELQTQYDEHDMTKIRYYFDGWYCTAAIQQDDQLPVMVSWTMEGELEAYDISAFVDEGVGQAQEQMNQLLDALKQIASNGGSTGGEAVALLEQVETKEEASELMNALLDVFENDQTLTALESSRPLIAALLQSGQEALARGSAGQEAVDALQQELDALDLRISQCTANREKGLLTAEYITGLDPMEFDLSELLFTFDPSSLDAQVLCQAAADYAQAIAAGQYDVDIQLLDVEVKAAIIDLTVSWQELQNTQKAYDSAVSAFEQSAQDYARGSVDLETLYRAQISQNEAAASLYSAMCAFVRQADGLNHLTGGQVSGQMQWMAETYTRLFEDAVTSAKVEAALAQAQQVETETGVVETDEQETDEQETDEQEAAAENKDNSEEEMGA